MEYRGPRNAHIGKYGYERQEGLATVLGRNGKIRIFQEVVRENDELSHEGSEGEFFGFAASEETEVERFEDRVVAGGDERGQGNYVASRGQMDFTKKDNGLNQYWAWWPYSSTNYDDDIGGWGSPGHANGVLMVDGWITAGFNALNQPMYIWSPANNGTSNWMYFGYDPLGRCVKRWVGDSGDVYSNPATYFHYDGWNLLQEGNNAWGPSRVYVHGNRIDEVVWSYNTFTGEQAFHHYDARGHCTLLTDSSGSILEQYEYDAFGWPYFFDANGNSIGAYDPVQNLWEGYSQFGNRFLFTGREWISDLKLYDYRNRMYQPELGRFLQPDPKEFGAADYNLYRYCHNDPVNRADPFGLIDIKIDRELDKLGGQASLNSLKEAANGAPAGVSQAVQEKNGKLSLGSTFGKSEIVTEKQLIGGRLQTVTTLKETAKSDEGHKVVAVGHVHQDKSIHAGPGFTKTDYKTAQGSEGHPGQPVYKVNESNPSVIIRLTPQVDYHDTPTERVISR